MYDELFHRIVVALQNFYADEFFFKSMMEVIDVKRLPGNKIEFKVVFVFEIKDMLNPREFNFLLQLPIILNNSTISIDKRLVTINYTLVKNL